MSIRIDGTLLVKKIASRNGPFCVGELHTEIGEFKVKDSLIDQFKEGKYEGRFWISQIYAHSYFAYGKVIIEIRARLSDIQIRDESELPAGLEKINEIDPAQEEISTNKKSSAEPSQKPPVILSTPKPMGAPSSTQVLTPAFKVLAPSTTSSTLRGPVLPDRSTPAPTAVGDAILPDHDLELFGEEQYALVQKRLPIKLDSATDDRINFRKQIARLGKLGYTFLVKNQTWVPK